MPQQTGKSTTVFDSPKVNSVSVPSASSTVGVAASILTMKGSNVNVNMIVSEFRSSTESIYQMNYAFDNNAYVFVFGERLALYEITATTFPGFMTCGSTDLDIDGVQDFFDSHKLRTGASPSSPVTLTIGGKTLTGYFVTFETSAAAEDSMRVHAKFTLLGYIKK